MIRQQWCACGAGVCGEADEHKLVDDWQKHHAQICHAGFIDAKPMKVSRQCPSCGVRVYEETTERANNFLTSHGC